MTTKVISGIATCSGVSTVPLLSCNGILTLTLARRLLLTLTLVRSPDRTLKILLTRTLALILSLILTPFPHPCPCLYSHQYAMSDPNASDNCITLTLMPAPLS